MKKFLYAFGIFLCVIFAACSSDTQEDLSSLDKNIFGTWTHYFPDGDGMGNRLIFSKDGCWIGRCNANDPAVWLDIRGGVWKTEDNVLTLNLTWELEGSLLEREPKLLYTYEIKDNILILKDSNNKIVFEGIKLIEN